MSFEIMFLAGVVFAWIVAPALVHMIVALVHMIVALYHLFTGGTGNE